MRRVIRVNGENVRNFVTESATRLPIMPKKLLAVLWITLFLYIDFDTALVGIDKYLNHSILTYKKDLKDVPYVVICLGFLAVTYISILLIPIFFRTLSFKSAVVAADGDFILIHNNNVRLSNLSELEIVATLKRIQVVAVNDGNRESFDFAPVYPNAAGIFAGIAGLR